MGKRFTVGSLCLPIGLGLIYGSASELLAMPEILQMGSVVLGLALTSIGLFAFAAHWSEGKSSRLNKKYLEFIARCESAWDGHFIPAFFVFFVACGTLGWNYAKHSISSVWFIFEYPSNIDYARGDITINILLSNDTDKPVTINDFRLIELSMNTKIYSPYQGIDLCNSPVVLQLRSADDQTNPEGSPPMTGDMGDYQMTVARQLAVSVDGRIDDQKTVTVDAHKGIELSLGRVDGIPAMQIKRNLSAFLM